VQIERKLAEWREAGLLDEAAVERILAHEAAREKRPYLLYAVGGLGAFAVAIGLLSIVAANWEDIPGRVKLAVDFALLLGLAAGVWKTTRGSWLQEVVLFVFYGAVLGSVGLVAQVYHLGGRAEDALLFWSLITAPIVLHGGARFLAAVFYVALETTVLMQAARLLERRWERLEHTAFLTVAYLLCLALIGLGGWRFLREKRPSFAQVAGSLGALQVLALASIMPLWWYDRWATYDAGGLGWICFFGAVGFGLALAFRATASDPPAPSRNALIAVAVLAPIACYSPMLIEHSRGWGHDGHTATGLAAALTFMAFWAAVGVAAYRAGRIRLLNVATALIGLRLLVIYFEVFGSLLDTGIGLLTGGLLMILLAWVWVKKVRASEPPAEPRRPGHG
jgi:uncharacterized membrane protein